MRSIRYTSFFAGSAVGSAVGLFTGMIYHKISYKHEFEISAAEPIFLDTILSKCVEKYVKKHTSLMKYGFPSYDTLRVKDNFILAYDRRNRVPHWVMEHLTSNTLEDNNCLRGKSKLFFEDTTIHTYFKATLDDYRNSGYDKGHLATARNYKHSQQAYKETYVLSNMTPQNGHFNQGIWSRLEERVLQLVKRHGSVYVCTGPLYLPREIDEELEKLLPQQKKRKRKLNKNLKVSEPNQKKQFVVYEVIGDNKIAVPTDFFKVILCEEEKGTLYMEAYIIPNEPVNCKEDLKNFMVPRETIEKAAGLLVFDKLPSSSFRCINGKGVESHQSPENLDYFYELDNIKLKSITLDEQNDLDEHSSILSSISNLFRCRNGSECELESTRDLDDLQMPGNMKDNIAMNENCDPEDNVREL